MRMPLLFGVKTVVDSNRGRLETCRGKSAMPLLEADKGMALFPQPQLLQGYANADLQKLNAARWFCFNPRRPARRQANPPYLLPAYTLTSRARKSLENAPYLFLPWGLAWPTQRLHHPWHAQRRFIALLLR